MFFFFFLKRQTLNKITKLQWPLKNIWTLKCINDIALDQQTQAMTHLDV